MKRRQPRSTRTYTLLPYTTLFRSKQVVLELRPISGAAHRVGVDQQRHVGFLVAVLADMQVEHELRQRAVQARELAAQHGEARAGQLRPGVAVEPAVAGAELDVVEHLEVEAARRAPARLLDVLRLVLAGRHRVVGQVGDAQDDRVEFRADAVELGLRRLEPVAEAGHPGPQRRGLLALRVGLADRLPARVAHVLQLLRTHLDALARRFQPLHRRDVALDPARGAQAFGTRGGALAQPAGSEEGR